MLPVNNFQLLPIQDPFVGAWNIDQVFQLTLKDGDAEFFAYGYWDNTQFCNIIQIGQDAAARFFTAPDATRIGQIIRHLAPDAASFRFTEAAWARDVGVPLPALNQTEDLMALRMLYIHENGAVSFTCVKQA